MTPRKTQRRQNQHAQRYPVPVQTSDYDSEAMNPVLRPKLAHEEMNLAVLQRWVPSLVQILARAPKGELYTFSREFQEWDKGNVEGNLFVGKLTPSPITGAQRHCIIILNRKGLNNLIIESGEIETVEITPEFLLLGFRRDEGQSTEVKIVGFYIFADPDLHSREYICQLIKEHWEMAKMDQYRNGQQEAISYDDEVMESIEEGADRPLGRRLSLSELFGTR